MTGRLPEDLRLTDGVVTLRRWRTTDVPALTEIWQDRELQQRFGVEPPVTDASSTGLVAGNDERWRAGVELALAIVVDGRVVGGCELDRVVEPEPDVGYWLAPSERGHGYATRAATLVLEWAEASLGIDRFTIEVEADNEASIAVAQRLGFVLMPGVERADGDRRLSVYELNR